MVKSKNTSHNVYRRVVVKFGTSLLTGGRSSLDEEMMASLVRQVADLCAQGRDVIIVSSGAIASGKHKLGFTRKIKGIPFKQVCFAVGQSRLMNVYERLFDPYKITIAQGLLTKAELSERHGYLNTRNSLTALMDMGVVCIVNENDMVAVDEIRDAKFGDNDNLSAMVANLVDADLLVILTEVDGLFTADPHVDPDARLISEVRNIDVGIEKMASGTSGSLGTGGMTTKIEAARLATSSGVTTVIANGRTPDILLKITAGGNIGTKFIPASNHHDSRERWMLSGLSTRGALIVDEGAAAALRSQKRSLLAAGICGVEGSFQRGDIVRVLDNDNSELGSGITNYSATDINLIKGMQSQKIATMLGCEYGAEVIHRNNLVIV